MEEGAHDRLETSNHLTKPEQLQHFILNLSYSGHLLEIPVENPVIILGVILAHRRTPSSWQEFNNALTSMSFCEQLSTVVFFYTHLFSLLSTVKITRIWAVRNSTLFIFKTKFRSPPSYRADLRGFATGWCMPILWYKSYVLNCVPASWPFSVTSGSDTSPLWP